MACNLVLVRPSVGSLPNRDIIDLLVFGDAMFMRVLSAWRILRPVGVGAQAESALWV